MSESRGLAVLLLLLLAAALTGWLLLHTERVLTPQAPSRARLPDYRLTDVRLRVYDADGALHYRLDAARVIHYPDPDRAELSAPRLRWYPRPEAVPWRVQSPQGEILDRGEEVRLLGRVRIDRAAVGDHAAVAVRTRDLLVWPRRDLARTDAPVSLRSGGAQMEGIGMRADLAQDRLLLLSTVRGTYVRPNS